MNTGTEVRDDLDNGCPSNDYTPGKPAGKCWGDGHYLCEGCANYEPRFVGNPELRERVINPQGIQVTTIF